MESQSETVGVLQRLVGIDSVNPELVAGAAGERMIAAWCADWLSVRGFEVHRLEEHPGRPTIVGIRRGTGGGSSLMLTGTSTPSAWAVTPGIRSRASSGTAGSPAAAPSI